MPSLNPSRLRTVSLPSFLIVCGGRKPSIFQRSARRSGVCLRMSRSAWMFVSAVFEQNCRTTSPWQSMRVERVVGKLLHGDQARRPDFLQAVAVVEERRPERDGHGQIVREDDWPEQAVVRRRISRVQGRRFAAFHEKSDALGQGSKQPLEPGAVLRQNVEARDQRGGWLRRRSRPTDGGHRTADDPACRHRPAPAFRPASPGPESRAPSRWRRPPSPSGDRAFRVAARARLSPASDEADENGQPP